MVNSVTEDETEKILEVVKANHLNYKKKDTNFDTIISYLYINLTLISNIVIALVEI